MFKSIRWKFITIYFLLVFIAMVIVGVFIIQQFEEYYLGEKSDNLTDLAQKTLIPSIGTEGNIEANQDEIQKIVDTWAAGFGEEIFVIDTDFMIIASSNSSLLKKNAIDVLDYELLADGLRTGEISETHSVIQSRNINAKNMVFPLKNEVGEVQGLLYLRSDLTEIYEALEQSKGILKEATVFALLITVVLGFLIARSVTEPITDVTVKAAKMAKGDFDQVVEVKSDDEIGQLAGMFNYLTEKLKITLSEISSEKSKMETILTYMADGLIAVDNSGKIIHANPSAMHMLGLTEEMVKSLSYDQVIGELNYRLTLEYMEEYNQSWMGSDIIKVNNSIYHGSFAPFKDEKGEKAGIVMVFQDITERQKLDNMRKEFVANVSHELKTPLTSIKSYTETLLDGALEDRALSEQFLQVVDTEADRMTRLVRDLLQLSSLDYKQVKWNKKEEDLVQLIEGTVLKLEMTAKNKKQRMNFVTHEETMISYMDKDKVEQVILNLLSNAIKYTPDEGKIDIFLEKEGNESIIRVVDNGIGIPPEDLPRLFERFYRVDKARSREMGGTGLGLSIAQQIVEAHDGSIHIHSVYGEGTEVVIRLPLEEASV